MNQIYSHILVFQVLFVVLFYNGAYSQNTVHPLSFEANQGDYNDSYSQDYYHIKKEGTKYRLTTNEDHIIFEEVYDTILKNAFFIKTVKGDAITIYRCKNLEKIEIPNLKQVYFERDGLDVLTPLGAQYYDNSITKINSFPKLDALGCGHVYYEHYRLSYSNKTKKHSIKVSKDYFGDVLEESFLECVGLPDTIEHLSFLNGRSYVSKSVNNWYNMHPHLIKIVKDGKSGIYSYTLEEATYWKKEETEVKEKPEYGMTIVDGDTIFIPVDVVLIEPDFTKKGTIKLRPLIPIEYNLIEQNPLDGLVYLYKDNKVGIYPNHTITGFDFLKAKTTSFYKIIKNGKEGWLDINTFKEYYFE